MTPNTEETPTADDVALADAQARAALIEAEATGALAAFGCVAPELLRPDVLPRLAAIHTGEGDPLEVFAVDAKGNVRTGPTGPMRARDAVRELLNEHPAWGHRYFRNVR